MKKIASIIIIVILNLLFYKNVFDEWYIICLVTFITSTITLLILTVILYYLERKIGLSKLQKINKDDPNKFTYYRDLLNECTIGEIGYLYNKNRRTKLVISSEIELLKQRGKIVIENDNIKIINKDNCTGTEKYILDHYIFLETREIANNENPQGLKENLSVAKRGSKASLLAKEYFENETHKKAVTSENNIGLRYFDDIEKIENN